MHFRVWAPDARTLSLVWTPPGGTPGDEPRAVPLGHDKDGYAEVFVPEAAAGTRYAYRFEDGLEIADPASRFQPDGPHGWSEVIDPAAFQWTDRAWGGISVPDLVISEIHIGTFTVEGTWQAALAELPALAQVGITAVEVMPVGEFPGQFGWGYDGVNLFAPTRLYGRPDDMRAFVDGAHALGMSVILDVVYNHFGPDGCWLKRLSSGYFSDRGTEWGQSINFDGPGSDAVREFFLANAACWVDEFHLDGLRLDATHAIVDESPMHIVREIARAAKRAAGARRVWIVGENEPQQSRFLRGNEQAPALDALWNDDFHHSAFVALTGRREAYFTDYTGSPQEFISAFKYGFLYQGQWYSWQRQKRGELAFGLPHECFVHFLENHDQIANSRDGLRRHAVADPGRFRALTALLLLGPATPLLFQGQEYGASGPFLYFADHTGELAALVAKGRRDFLSQFPSLAREPREAFADPAARATFDRSKLDPSDRTRHPQAVALHASLLELRRTDPTFRARGAHGIDGAVIERACGVLRFFGDPAALDGPADRLLLFNLGQERELLSLPEPLLAPPGACDWSIRWSSENPAFGGHGVPELRSASGAWRLPAESATVLFPVREDGR